MKNSKNSSLLFEIGVEEIPSAYFQNARASILTKAPLLFSECGYEAKGLKVFTTPRRIVIYAAYFSALDVQIEEKLGPQKEQSFRDGKPTPALEGFLKSVQCKESDIYYKETPRGTRVCVKVKKERKPLRHFFETLPTQIEFPKLMRWDASNYKFTRPIRWTFAYVGNQFQKYKIAEIQSTPYSYGHRFLSPQKFKVINSSLEKYKALLKQRHVVLDVQERVKKIESFIKGDLNKNWELIHTLSNLVEEPAPIKGSFDKKYLKLPAIILKTCMSKNQKIFALYDESGKLTNSFLAVINGPRKSVSEISNNFQSVLTSRLEDAEFFFREDQKTKLESKVQKLKEMIFLGSLGSYLDKTKRIESLVEFLGKKANLGNEIVSRAVRAAHLAKTDLMTHLVYEFPELQGVAGYEYAKLDGEPKDVAEAITGHYLPQNLSEDYKKLKDSLNLEGTLVGLSDRIDLLVGATGIGIELSASQDPYALRRAGGGIVKILRARPLDISLAQWIQKACEGYGKLIKKSSEEILTQLTPFFKDRVISELQVKTGTREYELLQSIMASDFDSLITVFEKFENLVKDVSVNEFIQACKVMERTGNILKGIKEKISDTIDPSLFKEPSEQKLYDILVCEEKNLQSLLEEKKYAPAVKRYGQMFHDPIHDFFDHVLVNAEDLQVRGNRQALVKKINFLCRNHIADLSFFKNAS